MTLLEVGQKIVRVVDVPGSAGPRPNIRVLTVDAPSVVRVQEGKESNGSLRLLLEAVSEGYGSYRIEFQSPSGEFLASGGEQFRVLPVAPKAIRRRGRDKAKRAGTTR